MERVHSVILVVFYQMCVQSPNCLVRQDHRFISMLVYLSPEQLSESVVLRVGKFCQRIESPVFSLCWHNILSCGETICRNLWRPKRKNGLSDDTYSVQRWVLQYIHRIFWLYNKVALAWERKVVKLWGRKHWILAVGAGWTESDCLQRRECSNIFIEFLVKSLQCTISVLSANSWQQTLYIKPFVCAKRSYAGGYRQ